MNKDVIYVEPEDDITDIILKIENSKEKIIALVPPKKAGVFRSVVNIKLMAKSGVTSGKKIVLVTTDPSIVRLAAATKIPVTKDLQTAPMIPVAEAEIPVHKEELVEESDGTVETKEDVEGLVGGDAKDKSDSAQAAKSEAKAVTKGDEAEGEDEEDGAEADSKQSKKAAKKAAKEKAAKEGKGGPLGWIKAHKKLTIFSGVAMVAIIGVLVWALVFAPAVSIAIDIKAASNYFSENVRFVTKTTDENAQEGKFYLDQRKLEVTTEVTFEATGEKNLGEKAKGDVVVYYYFPIDGEGGTIPINTGTIFTINGLSYASSESVTIKWDGDLEKMSKNCENYSDKASLKNSGCMVSKRVAVTASEPGTKYNIGAEKTSWTTLVPVGVYSDKPMTGGTDKVIKVVQQSDVEKIKNDLVSKDEVNHKDELLEKVSDDELAIESSFEQSTSSAEATPAVGEEVKEGVTPKVRVVTTATMYTIDKKEIEKYIRLKAAIGESQEIYEIKNPFIENFVQADGGFSGKLKTTYYTGPKISESDTVEKIRGKGLGDAQRILKDIPGVAQVTIDKSYPWVMSVPGDTNKITISFNVKDQDGKEIDLSASSAGEDGKKNDKDAKSASSESGDSKSTDNAEKNKNN